MGYAQDYANAYSQIVQQRGNAQAQGSLNSGNAWAGALGQIGQIAAQVPQQLQQARVSQQEQQIRQQQIDAAQKAQRDQAMLDAAYESSTDANGQLDINKVLTMVPGHLQTSTRDALAKFDEHVNTAKKTQAEIQRLNDEHQKAMDDALGNLALGVRDHGYSAPAFMTAVAAAKAKKLITDDEAKQLVTDLSGDKLKETVDSLIAKSGEASKRLADSTKPIVVGGSIMTPQGGVVATAPMTPDQQADNARQTALDAENARHNKATEAQGAGNLAARWSEAMNKPKVTPNEALSATMRLRKDFETETKSAQQAVLQFEQMKSSLDAVKSGKSPAGSQGVLVTFQKLLDPLSVVRESEYARSAEGLGILSQLQGKFDQIKNGGAGVPTKDLEDFVSVAKQFADNQRKYAQTSKDQIDKIATSYGLDPSHITRDLEMPGQKATPQLVQTAPPDQSGNWRWDGSKWVRK